MARLLTRLALLVFIALLTTACAGGAMLGAASTETQVTELLVTCLSCGERWLYVPSASLGAGLLSLFRRRKVVDKCPKCGSREVAFGHRDDGTKGRQGRIA
jgi:predicted nucleic-acid-binding Zn-ribbon protein